MSGLRLFTGVDYVTNVVCWAGNHITTMTDSVYVLLHEPWWPFILSLSNSVGAALFLIVQWNVQSGQSSFFAATKWSCHQRMSFIDWQWVGGVDGGWTGEGWNEMHSLEEAADPASIHFTCLFIETQAIVHRLWHNGILFQLKVKIQPIWRRICHKI